MRGGQTDGCGRGHRCNKLGRYGGRLLVLEGKLETARSVEKNEQMGEKEKQEEEEKIMEKKEEEDKMVQEEKEETEESEVERALNREGGWDREGERQKCKTRVKKRKSKMQNRREQKGHEYE